jgi:hypothetical protein
MYAMALVASNFALVETFEAKARDEQPRAAAGLPARARRRQRTTLAGLVARGTVGTTTIATIS